MAKYTKTWRIGEYCKGGVITTEVKGTKITIIGKDWDFSTGSRKSSNQTNAKEWCRHDFECEDTNNYRDVSEILLDITTSYWCDQIIAWFESKDINLTPTFSRW